MKLILIFLIISNLSAQSWDNYFVKIMMTSDHVSEENFNSFSELSINENFLKEGGKLSSQIMDWDLLQELNLKSFKLWEKIQKFYGNATNKETRFSFMNLYQKRQLSSEEKTLKSEIHFLRRAVEVFFSTLDIRGEFYRKDDFPIKLHPLFVHFSMEILFAGLPNRSIKYKRRKAFFRGENFLSAINAYLYNGNNRTYFNKLSKGTTPGEGQDYDEYVENKERSDLLLSEIDPETVRRARLMINIYFMIYSMGFKSCYELGVWSRTSASFFKSFFSSAIYYTFPYYSHFGLAQEIENKFKLLCKGYDEYRLWDDFSPYMNKVGEYIRRMYWDANLPDYLFR